VLESVSPFVQLTIPAAQTSGATIATPNAITYRIDTTDAGKYTRRLVAPVATRPQTVSVSAGGQTAAFTVLAVNGAELADSAWTPNQFVRDSLFTISGKYSWYSASGGDLRSPVISVPADADTVSLVFWTRYAGSGFTELPYGDVQLSVDGGSTFQRIMRLEGYAPIYYPEQVTVGGVKGKKIVFDFVPNGLPWNLDEIAVVSHGAVTSTPPPTIVPLRPSENPVRHSTVYFSWPFGNSTGEMRAYDISGRLIWKTVVAGAGNVAWDLNAGRVANGVYIVIAQDATSTMRLKLFVTRNGS
jgi:hypothetical protein